MRCTPHSIDPEKAARSCGFLTKTERQYLLDEWDPNGDGEGYTEEQKRKKRMDIETRARHALADFALLQERADQELKDGIIQLDSDPAIFDVESTKHMEKGMVRLASDLSVNEEFTNLLFQAIDSEGGNEDVLGLLEASMAGDEERFAEEVGQLLVGMGISKQQLKQLL